MAFLRKYGKLAVLVWLAIANPFLVIIAWALGHLLQRRTDDAIEAPGSANPAAPSAYDMVPTALIAIPRVPRDPNPQTTELVVPPAPIGRGMGNTKLAPIRVVVPSHIRPKLS